MTKMLRNTPNAHTSYVDICRCPQCRTDNRRGDDAMVRRAQRARERREVVALVTEEC